MTAGRDIASVGGAHERVEAMRASGLWTSDLSVAEYLLLLDVGYEPLGLVVGSSIYQVATFVAPQRSGEIERLSQSMYDARGRAMARMQEEARALGAAGIVGVRLEIRFASATRRVVELVAIGTAIREAGGREPAGAPFTSAVSGQEFWALRQAGALPVGLVLGCCVVRIAPRPFWLALGQLGQSVELANQTQALYDARERAMARMQSEAEALGADGIVGVDVREDSHVWGRRTVELLAIGTAIVRGADAPRPPSPTPVLALDG